MKTKLIIGLLVVAVLALLVYFAPFNGMGGASYESKEIFARVQRVEGDTVYAKGEYVDPSGRIVTGMAETDFVIKVTPETRINKEVWYMLTQAEIDALGGRVTSEQIRKSLESGALSDLTKNNAENFPITVLTTSNIAGKKRITASEIKYFETVYPEEL